MEKSSMMYTKWKRSWSTPRGTPTRALWTSCFIPLNPHGVSGVIVIAESHLAIHTWPEFNFASIDIYTCGPEINPWSAYHFMVRKLKPKI